MAAALIIAGFCMCYLFADWACMGRAQKWPLTAALSLIFLAMCWSSKLA